MESIKYDINKEISELINQLSYPKRMIFLLGAGASKAIGLPDIETLTISMKKNLSKNMLGIYSILEKTLSSIKKNNNIEGILNHTRLIRELTNDSKELSFNGISGQDAKLLDLEICKNIYSNISEAETKMDLTPMIRFVSWINWLSKDYIKEIFTTNYDLVIEKALEHLSIPYFDGFVGANEPFFVAESVETEKETENLLTHWIRLWKLHGSLSWFWKENKNKTFRIVRKSIESGSTKEIVIYPSKDKYESSRKLPFTSYFDRLRKSLISEEGLLVINGYSFIDEHINEIIFKSANRNNRLSIIGFFYDDAIVDRFVENEMLIKNLCAIGPTKAIINGNYGVWDDSKISDKEAIKFFWDDENKKIKLGDFRELVTFLLKISGKQIQLEKEIGKVL